MAWRRGPLLHAKFHPHRCNVSPLRGENPQNRPLSKLNTGRFALRAMLPVTTTVLRPFVRDYAGAPVKFGMEGTFGPLLHAKFRCCLSV